MATWRWKRQCLGYLAALLVAGHAAASAIQVTVDTSGLAGTSANLAFDLIDGSGLGDDNNTLTITDFSTDGTLGTASVTHGFTTNPASDLSSGASLGDSDFFNEFLQGITLGTTLSFRFDTTGILDSPTPDEFSFYLLTADASASLVSTDDPLLTNALFTFDIGVDTVPQIFTVTDPAGGVTVRAAQVTSSVPEPGVLALSIVALFALAVPFTIKR